MAEQRAIFEEVGVETRAKATPGALSRDRNRGRIWLNAWLATLFFLVVLMIAIGGATRLTDSGLSITEWAPIQGAVPPLSQADWDREFALYQTTTEYQEQNSGMSMADFRFIYWWEWGHRQLGRVIGLVWGVGLAGLLIARAVPPGWLGRFVFIGALGGLQGAIGWWMVSSGLAPGMLDVASYRLATHLGLAFIILAFIGSYMLQLSRPEAELMQARRGADHGLKRWSTALLAVTFVQVLVGALVAGIDAGRSYVDWPLMNGQFFPPQMWVFDPLWRNFFENAGTVQFVHRVLGYALVLFGIGVWVRSRRSANRGLRRAYDWMLAAMFAQMVIGIVTILNAAPLWLGLTHQFGAVVLVSVILRARFLAIYPPAQS
ncbi:MAG: heme A synthase, partial [Pseudomonadota bacterium]